MQSAADIVIDEELKTLIPPLGAEEYEALEKSITVEGCRDSLVVWTKAPSECEWCDSKGGFSLSPRHHDPETAAYHCDSCGEADTSERPVLVDGHNRYEICRKHGIGFSVIERQFASRVEAILWMIDNQMGRRNLADIDRIALARKREEVLRPLARENLKTPTGGRGLTPAKLPESKQPIDTRKESARTAGVGERTYDAGKLILDAAASGELSQDELNAIRRKEKSIHRVAKDIKEKRKQKKRESQRQAAVVQAAESGLIIDGLHQGDFRDHFDKVADGSLSLIFTDPPYDREASKLYEDLGRFAEAKLCDGGSLVTYIGQTQLPIAVGSLCNHLRYWWTVCCLHSGGANLMNEYGIRCGWKAVLWFVKGTRNDPTVIVSDVMSGGREKSHHDWQQSQEEAEYWIQNLCPADGIVCDPFMGGGTTAAAAIACGRKWIGFEKDAAQVAMVADRIGGA